MRASKRAVRSFNPRVLAGGRDLRFSALLWYVCRFNPRVLAGGRDRSFRTSRKIIASFQSTRPRGRTRRPDCGYEFPREVSIHASSREDATSLDVSAGASGIVSIHASSREDATVPARLQSPEIGFNPRVLAGGRDVEQPSAGHRIPVSIHASSREDATMAGTMPDSGTRVSIHASSREDATSGKMNRRVYLQFQSTRPRGRTRQINPIEKIPRSGFNPRVLAGGRDVYRASRESSRLVSIHASSREDATVFQSFRNIIRSFNPRVLAGGRDTHYVDYHNRVQFQSTRPRGRTRRPNSVDLG